MIGWRRALRRGRGRPDGKAEATTLEATEPPPLAAVVGQEPRGPRPDPLPAPDEASHGDHGEPALAVPSEPPAEADEGQDAGEAARAGETGETGETGEAGEAAPPDQVPPVEGVSPVESTDEADDAEEEAVEAAASEIGPHPQPDNEALDPVPTVVTEDAGKVGEPSDDLARDPTDHVHWAVVASVMVATAAAVAMLLLLAGHVL